MADKILSRCGVISRCFLGAKSNVAVKSRSINYGRICNVEKLLLPGRILQTKRSSLQCILGAGIYRTMTNTSSSSSSGSSSATTSAKVAEPLKTKDLKLETKDSKPEPKMSKPDTKEAKSGAEGSAKSEKEKENNSWITGKNAWKLGLLSIGAGGALLGTYMLFVWGRPEHDQHGIEIIDEFSTLPVWKAYPMRALKELHFYQKMFQEPSSRKLLPDPVKEPYFQPPYTLVLEMTGVLVHPVWSLNAGWRFKKRPGVEVFLQQVTMPLFEVVIYTHEQGFTAYPIIDALDPNGFVSYRLFRDATRYESGEHTKDLACLNRDLSKVILVDCSLGKGQRDARNVIVLPKWTGDDNDRTLFELAAFLRTVAMSGVDDVRKVLDYYNQFDNPLEEFGKKQRQLAEMQQQTASDSQAKDKKTTAGGFTRGLTGWRK
jgi:import inner membrane translocase subunit TIM50